MARSFHVVWLLISGAAPALGQTDTGLVTTSPRFHLQISTPERPADARPPPDLRIFAPSWREPDGAFASTQIAPSATLGIGLFGLKREGPTYVTAREIDSPRTRRVAVGFSLKF